MLIAALQHWRVAVWVALLALAAGQTVRLDAARAALAQERANHEAAALAAQVPSANWPEKVSNYLQRVETFSSSATTK